MKRRAWGADFHTKGRQSRDEEVLGLDIGPMDGYCALQQLLHRNNCTLTTSFGD